MLLEHTERTAGGRPPTCPWRALESPFVYQVLRLYDVCGGMTEAGPVPARVLPMAPAHRVWEGLLHYCHAVNLVRAEVRREEKAQRESSKAAKGALPPGPKPPPRTPKTRPARARGRSLRG